MNILQSLLKLIGLAPAVEQAIDYARGIDISRWEGSFDPTKATKPIHFAFQKLTDGTSWIDTAVDTLWQGVQQIPVRGGYHYQRSGFSWLTQAEHFLRVAERFDFHFHILDVERNKLGSSTTYDNAYSDTFFADMRRIIDHWRAAYPKKLVVLYTNVDTYQNYIYPTMLRLYGEAGIEWLNGVLLWIAQPGVPAGKPNMPKQRSKWDFHQYSFVGKAEEYGTQGAVDENVFNGTIEELHQLVGGVTQPPPTEEPPPPPPDLDPVSPETEPQVYFAEVVKGPVIVRSYPERGTATDTTLRLFVGEAFEGRIWAGNGYVWIQIEVSSRIDLIGNWAAVRTLDGSGRLIKLTIPNSTTPPPSVDPVVRETLGFFDPPMVEHFDLDIPLDWKGDFDHNNLMLRFANNPQKTQANAIAAWWVLTEADMEWLWHIQPQDEDIYVNATLQNKKNWHLNTEEGGNPTRPIWKSGNQYRYGLMVYGHADVQVQDGISFKAQFPGGQNKVAEFTKVVGITRDMMKPMGEYVDYVVRWQGKSYSTRIRSGVIPLIEQGLVQICTEPNKARKISITNKGIKTMFVPGAGFVNKPDGDFWLWKGGVK